MTLNWIRSQLIPISIEAVIRNDDNLVELSKYAVVNPRNDCQTEPTSGY